MSEQKHYFTSPFGVAVYPWLNRADTEYDAAGRYHTRIVVPMEEAAEFIAYLEAIRDAKYDELPPNKQPQYSKAAVYTEEFDDEGQPTGNVIFQAKMRANVTYTKNGKEETFSQRPEVVDMDNNTVQQSVWSGSTIRLRGQVVPYAMPTNKAVGVSLRLAGVQVKELVTGTGNRGFGDEGGTMPGHAS